MPQLVSFALTLDMTALLLIYKIINIYNLEGCLNCNLQFNICLELNSRMDKEHYYTVKNLMQTL